LRGRTTLQSNPELKQTGPRILIYDFHQDDPRKCTSAKLQKFRLASELHSLKQIPRSAIVLNPSSSKTLSAQDRELVQRYGLVGLDCSWNLSEDIFEKNIGGENRRLPLLLAGNPTNYSSRGKLSTAEALAAALFITGFGREAERLLDIFSWGHTFLTLNKEPLSDYALASPDQMEQKEREYFP
jgi:pre-rRNA-processing protein TSR3